MSEQEVVDLMGSSENEVASEIKITPSEKQMPSYRNGPIHIKCESIKTPGTGY